MEELSDKLLRNLNRATDSVLRLDGYDSFLERAWVVADVGDVRRHSCNSLYDGISSWFQQQREVV
jgi:hypothetical protein